MYKLCIHVIEYIVYWMTSINIQMIVFDTHHRVHNIHKLLSDNVHALDNSIHEIILHLVVCIG